MRIGAVRYVVAGLFGLSCGTGEAVVLQSGSLLGIGAGSWFALSQDTIVGESEMVSVAPGADGGLLVGDVQALGYIDAWVLAGSAGGHYTTAAPSGSTETGIDLSGWGIWWNGQSQADGAVDEGSWLPGNCDALGCTGVTFAPGNAYISWSGVYGDSYELWYSWRFNPTPGCFGCAINYLLHFEGTVNMAQVPVPAAVWLFGSGLLGLCASLARSS